MGDFYFHKNQMNKAKNFSKITELSNVNPKLRIEVEKRLNRDFSE